MKGRTSGPMIIVGSTCHIDGELKGTITWSIPRKCEAPESGEKYGGACKTTQGVRKLLNKKRNVLCKVIRARESTCKKVCAYA